VSAILLQARFPVFSGLGPKEIFFHSFSGRKNAPVNRESIGGIAGQATNAVWLFKQVHQLRECSGRISAIGSDKGSQWEIISAENFGHQVPDMLSDSRRRGQPGRLDTNQLDDRSELRVSLDNKIRDAFFAAVARGSQLRANA
jgi:hypothetical protein